MQMHGYFSQFTQDMVVFTHFNALNNVDCKMFMDSSKAKNTVHLDLHHFSDDVYYLFVETERIKIKYNINIIFYILCDLITIKLCFELY